MYQPKSRISNPWLLILLTDLLENRRHLPGNASPTITCKSNNQKILIYPNKISVNKKHGGFC